jgi:uncharacterized protein (DUF433 family)
LADSKAVILALVGAAFVRIESRIVSGRIEVDPEVMLGKPVVRGTRIPVELVLRKLAEGASSRDLVDACTLG